jgi:hypothetical protein
LPPDAERPKGETGSRGGRIDGNYSESLRECDHFGEAKEPQSLTQLGWRGLDDRLQLVARLCSGEQRRAACQT